MRALPGLEDGLLLFTPESEADDIDAALVAGVERPRVDDAPALSKRGGSIGAPPIETPCPEKDLTFVFAAAAGAGSLLSSSAAADS